MQNKILLNQKEKNEVLIPDTTQMNLGNALSGRNQSQEITYFAFPFI